MGRQQRTNMDMGGNSLIHAQLDPRASDPVWPDRCPWAPWINTVRGDICWFDDVGGLHCLAAGSAAGSSLLHETLQMDAGGTIPTAFDPARTHVFVDLDNFAADLDLTGWVPTVPTGPSVEFRFRKIDTSPFKIIWTDPVTGIVYSFVDKQHEFITLAWDGVNGVLSIA